MTKQEQNDIIKRVWTEHLQRKDDIPESLADGYSIWLRTKIREAASQLTTSQGSDQQQDQGNEQAGQDVVEQAPNVAAVEEGQPPMPEGGAA